MTRKQPRAAEFRKLGDLVDKYVSEVKEFGFDHVEDFEQKILRHAVEMFYDWTYVCKLGDKADDTPGNW